VTPADEDSVVPVRVVTWNVRSLRDDRHRVVDALLRLRPDVVTLQEAPRLLWDRRQLSSVAKRAGLRVAIDGRRGGGVGLLIGPDLQVTAAHTQPLSETRGKHRRTVAVAQLRWHGVAWVVASVHLGLSHVERVRHVSEIAAELDAYGALPCVVGADTNEGPQGAVSEAIMSNWRMVEALANRPSAAATFPAKAPTVRIDQVWVTPDITVRHCGVPALRQLDAASDHLPVVADLALPQSPTTRAG
jgi:endonuclease/exonuclease/phosphatase family metal-dependent hydrolase